MPLTWNAQKVANIDERLETDEQAMITQFCFVLMAIHINRVSEQNVAEVWTRIQIWEMLNGPLFYKGTTRESALTYDFVKSLVGYGTNVSNTPLRKWSGDLLTRSIAERQGYYETDKQKELADA
jgi:hypothetical protein